MNRRSLFKVLFAAPFAKDAIAVVKVAPKPASKLDSLLFHDTAKIQNQLLKVMSNKGRVSALMKGATLPSGAGFNFSSIITKKSTCAGGGAWIDAKGGDANVG